MTEIKHTKLTLETHHGEYSVKLPHWDITFDEYVEMCKSLALASLFSSKTVNKYFDESK